MKKCNKCEKMATSDNGLCNVHFSEWIAAEDGLDAQEVLEEMISRFGPDFEWFSEFFDSKFGYKGADKQKVYKEAYMMIKSLIETAYDLGAMDGPDDEDDEDMDFGDDD